MKVTALSAGAVVVRRQDEGFRFLVLRAYRNWDFPKGMVESGEDPLSAARREVAEETGIQDLTFPWGAVFHETAPYGRGKVARYYLAETDTVHVVMGINPELGRPEHHEYRWVSAEQARRLLPDRLHPVLKWAVETLSDS